MNYTICDSDGRPFDGSLEGTTQVNFGKTKQVYRMPDGTYGITHADVLTAFDNPAYTGQAPGKGTMSAYSSAVLFKRIEDAGVPTTHRGFINPNTTSEEPLEMLPFEIIWRRYNVDGNSWEKRNPGQVPVGQRYDQVKYEVGLKWSVINTADGQECTDPFMILDENFEPLLNDAGLPRLTHQKDGQEIKYDRVVHPNKKEDIPLDTLRSTISQYNQFASQIRQMAQTVQEVTFDTYAQIGRLNADGKIEVGLDSKGKLTLGDELELDALRNVSLQEIEVDGQTYTYETDLIGRDLNEVIADGAASVGRIIQARHSGKQAYRNLVKPWGEHPESDLRFQANKLAAQQVVQGIYAPTALALCDRFGRQVGLLLREVA